MCDTDVVSYCNLGSRNRGVFGIGAVGRCLSKRLAEGKPLDSECRNLVIAAAPRVRPFPLPTANFLTRSWCLCPRTC